MALKPNDQYEYRVCTSCEKKKKVHCDNEPLWDWDEWIGDNKHLPDPEYQGLCFRCTREALDFNWRKATSERYEAEGKPVPKWVWHQEL